MPEAVSLLAIRIFGLLAIAGVVNLALPTVMERVPQAARPNLRTTQNDDLPEGLINLTVSPDAIRALTPDEARRVNASIPSSLLLVRPSPRFVAPIADVESYGRALDCLTAAIYYEAGYESAPGQAAVAQVILNRMRHPAYPKTVCGVVFQGAERITGCQFTFTCDGALGRPPSVLGWARARTVAGSALNGTVASGVGMATHYHADFVVPYWAPSLVKIGQIGAHIFYRWPGSWGLTGAFTGRYRAPEPVILKMAVLSSFTEPMSVGEINDAAPAPELPPLPSIPATGVFVAIDPVVPSRTAPVNPAPQATAIAQPAPPKAIPPVLSDPLVSRIAPSQRARRIPAPES